MFLLIIVLYNEKNVKEILERFINIDVRGATVIDSQGMGTLLSDEIPIFSSLRHILSTSEKRTNNFTIFSAIKTEETLNKAIDTVNEVLQDINRPDTGIIIVMPVLKMYGFAGNEPQK